MIVGVLSLPQPDDLTSLVLRTDFTDDAAWAEIQALVDADAAAADDDKLTYLSIADATTMSDPERALLAVDLYDEPGRTFRVPSRWYAEVSANLSIANMDFDEFADAAAVYITADPAGLVVQGVRPALVGPSALPPGRRRTSSRRTCRRYGWLPGRTSVRAPHFSSSPPRTGPCRRG